MSDEIREKILNAIEKNARIDLHDLAIMLGVLIWKKKR